MQIEHALKKAVLDELLVVWGGRNPGQEYYKVSELVRIEVSRRVLERFPTATKQEARQTIARVWRSLRETPHTLPGTDVKLMLLEGELCLRDFTGDTSPEEDDGLDFSPGSLVAVEFLPLSGGDSWRYVLGGDAITVWPVVAWGVTNRELVPLNITQDGETHDVREYPAFVRLLRPGESLNPKAGTLVYSTAGADSND